MSLLFLQRVRIAGKADRCKRQTNSVRPFIRPSPSGVLSRGMKMRSYGLKQQLGQSF